MPEQRVLRAPVAPALLGGAADALADAFAAEPSAIGRGRSPAARHLLMQVPVVTAARCGGVVLWGDRLDAARPHVDGVSCWVPARRRGAGLRGHLRAGSWRLVPLLGPTALLRVLREAGATDRAADGYLRDCDAYLSIIGVRPSARGAGLGRSLVEATATDAAAAGLTRLVLLTHQPTNVGFYRTLGFQVLDGSARSRGYPLHVLARPL